MILFHWCLVNVQGTFGTNTANDSVFTLMPMPLSRRLLSIQHCKLWKMGNPWRQLLGSIESLQRLYVVTEIIRLSRQVFLFLEDINVSFHQSIKRWVFITFWQLKMHSMAWWQSQKTGIWPCGENEATTLIQQEVKIRWKWMASFVSIGAISTGHQHLTNCRFQ